MKNLNSFKRILFVFLNCMVAKTLLGDPPANDLHANRQYLPSVTTQTVDGTIAEATYSPGDPETGMASVWYSWTAPTTCGQRLAITSPGGEPWCHPIAYVIYGDPPNNVHKLAKAIGYYDYDMWDDEIGPGSDAFFYAVKGRHYRICVTRDPSEVDYCGGSFTNEFTLSLTRLTPITTPVQWCPPLSNDNFKTPYDCSTTSNRYFFQYMWGATFESGEINKMKSWCPQKWLKLTNEPVGDPHDNFLIYGAFGGTWCKWKAPKTGTASWSCTNVEADTRVFVGAFTGSSIGSLVRQSTGFMKCSWKCNAGTTYRLYCFSPRSKQIYSRIFVN